MLTWGHPLLIFVSFLSSLDGAAAAIESAVEPADTVHHPKNGHNSGRTALLGSNGYTLSTGSNLFLPEMTDIWAQRDDANQK